MKQLRFSGVFIGLIIFSLSIAAGCSMFGGEPPAPPIEVKAMVVEATDKPLMVDFIGQVQAFNTVDIKPQVSGFVTERLVAPGAVVTKGQLLYRINPQSYELARLQAQAELADVEASLANARIQAERARILYSKNAISLEEFQNDTTQLEKIAAKVDAAQSQLGIAEVNLGFTNIYAPIDGQLSITVLQPGSYVLPGQTTLVNISSYDPILVSFSITEAEYLAFMSEFQKGRAGQIDHKKVKLILENGMVYPQEGKISQVESGLTQGTGSLNLKAEFRNPNSLLLPGMMAKVRMIYEVRQNAILIPQRAVTDLMGKKMVTVLLEGNKTEDRQVKLGVKTDNFYLIEDGLQVGDVLVVEGGQKIMPGQGIKVDMLKLESFTSQVTQ